ncbi:MAG: aminotransferase class I/II-fold pyridoxal phosphate-dependent enzyme [Chloroflexia bacterium]|nr:aminotransferase class I/II-fold pyridoxal phosphate-dependent enzyme [Chloroflexia bacterium]
MNDEPFKKEFYNSINSNIHLPGSGSSRLLSGNSLIYEDLEKLISVNYKREACLLYNSGYHANTGILPALADKKDLIIADKLVHASLIDGMRLSSATTIRFKHLDYEHLEKTLIKLRDGLRK